jgi:hypothetical protein
VNDEPELGRQQRVRHEEEDAQEGQPRECLRPVVGDRAEGVEPDQRADQEEEDVEAAEVLLQLRLLLDGGLGRVLDELGHLTPPLLPGS